MSFTVAVSNAVVVTGLPCPCQAPSTDPWQHGSSTASQLLDPLLPQPEDLCLVLKLHNFS